jgi:alkyl sulfatase BDS1-like metallo-beta-lactamase superfamily hydrolase
MDAEFVDIGVGQQQVTPWECWSCQWTQGDPIPEEDSMPVFPRDAQELFDNITASIADNKTKAKGVGVRLLFVINGAGRWIFDHNTPALVKLGADDPLPTADCKVTMDQEDFRAMLSKPGNGMSLYFAGKIKIDGDPQSASRIQNFMGLVQ